VISRRKEIGMTFNNTAHCTGDFCDIAAPCTRMITYPDMLDYGNVAEYYSYNTFSDMLLC
jgi:hypothetical protein